jgi:hypothetical protein
MLSMKEQDIAAIEKAAEKAFPTQDFYRLLTGVYSYSDFGEESFEVKVNPDTKFSLFESKFLARLENGEMLKVLTKTLVSNHFDPRKILIERSLGEKHSSEFFLFNPRTEKFTYEFKCGEINHREEISWTKRAFVMAPNFLTKCLFSNQRKFEAAARTPFLTVLSINEWDFQEFPKERHIFASFNLQSAQTIEIGNGTYETMEISIVGNDSWDAKHEEVKMTVLKEYSIPMRATIDDGTQVELIQLRKFEVPQRVVDF